MVPPSLKAQWKMLLQSTHALPAAAVGVCAAHLCAAAASYVDTQSERGPLLASHHGASFVHT